MEHSVQNDRWTIGVDLGGTKIVVARVDASGQALERVRSATEVQAGPAAVEAEIIESVRQLEQQAGTLPMGIGIGVAGQIETTSGLVHFAPNLNWHDVPLGADLAARLGLPVFVINDVQAATWGEWLHGAGKGCSDLVCLFIGTGIGSGVISGGSMLSGCSHTVGEVGHTTIDMNGPLCHCGNRGCLEAYAGGWAIALRAQEAIEADPTGGEYLMKLAGGQRDAVTARTVAEAARAGDPMALRLLDAVAEALSAGAANIINAFNPCRLILGGGVIEGIPELIQRIDQGARKRALPAALASLRILPSSLHNDAGVTGAAAVAMQSLSHQEISS